MEIRKCNLCNEILELSVDNFQPSFDKKQNKIYFKKKCRRCERKICQKYHNDHRDSILEKKRQYEHINQDKKSNYNKKYNQRPATKKLNSIKALKVYYLNKHDPVFIMRRRISLSVNKYLKKNNSLKMGKSISNFLPYTIIELKDHLEKQFDKNMSWQNYGNYWHLDHIIPQSCLPYISMEDENFKKCWALDNLRPLEAKQNIKDGATRVRHKKYFLDNGPKLGGSR
jgi:hypothetical protein